MSNKRILVSENPKDLGFLLEALILAKENPDKITSKAVGALLVKNGGVIGRGFRETIILNENPYEDITYHAEDRALEEAGNMAEGGTLYVTLEPCTARMQIPEIHKTVPKPCCELISLARIKKVVVGAFDEDFGAGGTQYLLSRGIEVVTCGGTDSEDFKELVRNPITYSKEVEERVRNFYRSLEK